MSISDPEFRIVWQQRPYVHNSKQVMFVRARDKEAAEAVARDHVERQWGLDGQDGIGVHSVEPYTRPQGQVLG